MLNMRLELDHLVVCVSDLDSGSSFLWDRHGLASVPGGRHEGHGTANRIVPLGSTYIELVAVVDKQEATNSSFGSWVLERSHDSEMVDAICLRTDDLDEVSSRLGLEITEMERIRPDGMRLSWRLAGLEEGLSRGLPFFIHWAVPPELHPGRAKTDHIVSEVKLGTVTLTGDPRAVDRWVGDSVEGLVISDGDRPQIKATLLVEGEERLL